MAAVFILLLLLFVLHVYSVYLIILKLLEYFFSVLISIVMHRPRLISFMTINL